MKRVPHEIIEKIFSNHDGKNMLPLSEQDSLKDYLIDGRLYLENFDFYKCSSYLRKVNFNGFKLIKCNFYGMHLKACRFNDCEFEDNIFESVVSIGSVFSSDFDLQAAGIEKSGWCVSDKFSGWVKKMVETYPKLLFDYQYALNYGKLFDLDFIPVINISHLPGGREQNKEAKVSGWKIHLSLKNIKDIERAFNLIAPILYANFYEFKVIHLSSLLNEQGEPWVAANSLYLKNKQFTIYLACNDKRQPLLMKPELHNVLSEIYEVLKTSQIEVNVPSAGDAALKVPGFGLRNDRDLWYVYIAAVDTGIHYNPENQINPYVDLLLQEPSPFSPVQHFNDFIVDSLDSLFSAMQMTLIAYMNEYVYLDFPARERSKFSELINLFEGNNEIPNDMFKERYRETKFITEKIKQIALIFEFLYELRREEFWCSDFELCVIKDEALVELCHNFQEKIQYFSINSVETTIATNQRDCFENSSFPKTLDQYFILKMAERLLAIKGKCEEGSLVLDVWIKQSYTAKATKMISAAQGRLEEKMISAKGYFEPISSPINKLRWFNRTKSKENADNVPTLQQYALLCITNSFFFKRKFAPSTFLEKRFTDLFKGEIASSNQTTTHRFFPKRNESLYKLCKIYATLPQKLNLNTVSVFGEKEFDIIKDEVEQAIKQILTYPYNEAIKDSAEKAMQEFIDMTDEKKLGVSDKLVKLDDLVTHLWSFINKERGEGGRISYNLWYKVLGLSAGSSVRPQCTIL